LDAYLNSIEELDQKLLNYGMVIISRDHMHTDVFCLVCDIDHDHPKNSQIMTANLEYGWEYKMLEVPIAETNDFTESKKIISEMKEVISA
tara:strand:+ start:1294 stop:1563 length:270 start_codon:yes stop_codon:yes gene_type:complete